MSKGHFKLKSKIKLSDLTENDVIQESDFATLTPDGVFVQLQYHEGDSELKDFEVKSGAWMIQKTQNGMDLIPVEVNNDKILREFVNTKEITSKVDKFFSKLDVYKKYGIEVPKRGILLYGDPGTGKSTAINEVIRTYKDDGKTAIVMWPTDKYEAYQVKDFVRTFKYAQGVERLILVVEDIGGSELQGAKRAADASLLALLDNQEKVFTIPVAIIATTNFPDSLMGNLTNRPERFDDKIRVDYPSAEQRVALMRFYVKDEQVDEATYKTLSSDKCKEFSAAHIREILIRSAIYDLTHVDVIKQMCDEIKIYKDQFQKKMKMGFSED